MVRIFIKFSLTSGISDIKIGLKSGNPRDIRNWQHRKTSIDFDGKLRLLMVK